MYTGWKTRFITSKKLPLNLAIMLFLISEITFCKALLIPENKEKSEWRRKNKLKNVLRNFQEGFGNEARMTRQCTCNSKRQREFLGFQTELNPTRRTEICIIYRRLITCIIFFSPRYTVPIFWLWLQNVSEIEWR